jgi:hypothetical protein
VKDPSEYARCEESIEALEPVEMDVRRDPVENQDNRYSCAQALNLAWSRASSDLLVFCHEDVVFPPQWTRLVMAALRAVESCRPPWGILGPVGRASKRFVGTCQGSDRVVSHHGPLPGEVETLDEMCLLARRDLPLRFDESLGGYHLYGVDLCLQAIEAGLGCYAVDAIVRHDSTTRHRDDEYHRIKRRLQRKWMFRRRKIGRVIGTTCGRIRFGLLHGWL